MRARDVVRVAGHHPHPPKSFISKFNGIMRVFWSRGRGARAALVTAGAALAVAAKAAVIAAGLLLVAAPAAAQFNVSGDFQVRWTHSWSVDALDDRGELNYIRYLGRIRMSARISDRASFHSEFTTFTEPNPLSPVRSVAGTGNMTYGITQLFMQSASANVPLFDVARLRVGRQAFPIGSGLSQGASSYFVNLFDGVRVDLSRQGVTLSMMSAITRKELSPGGYFPLEGGDHLHVARLSTDLRGQHIMGYFIYNRLQGMYSDSYILGTGGRGSFWSEELEYFWEFAHQTFNTAPGLPEMGGYGLMGGIGHRWQMGPFRWFKIEGRYSAYQGNDPTTDRVERFSPQFPSFFWGDRSGFVNAVIGGNWPRDGRLREGGVQNFYGRMYVVPNIAPRFRLQVQYIHAREFVNHNNYNPYDDEFSIRLFYTLSQSNRFQLRYVRTLPNEDDFGVQRVTSLNDRFVRDRVMLGWRVRF